jgi:hypothetical protein
VKLGESVLVAALPAADDPTVSYAMASFSAPELADLLCSITDIRHLFS